MRMSSSVDIPAGWMGPKWGILLGICLLPLIPAAAVFFFHWQTGKLPKLRVHMPEVRTEEVCKWRGVLWVDARSRADYEMQHVEGAVWLSEDAWQEGLPALLDAWIPGKRVVVYCSTRSCRGSHAVAARLREETGWKEIFVLKGGWEKWQEFQGGEQ